MLLPVPNGKTVTSIKILKKYKNITKIVAPKRYKYRPLLQDNAPAHKARIVTEYLQAEKVTVLPNTPFSPDLAPSVFFLFLKLKFHPS